MAGLPISDFNARLDRIERAHAKGHGFEAVGTRGRSFYTRHQCRRTNALRMIQPVLTVLAFGTLIKALFLCHLGVPAYDMRVEHLLQGGGLDRIGGWVMQADPVTMQLAATIMRLTNLAVL